MAVRRIYDGRRFLVNTLVDRIAQASASYSVANWISTPITVVLNWTAALTK